MKVKVTITGYINIEPQDYPEEAKRRIVEEGISAAQAYVDTDINSMGFEDYVGNYLEETKVEAEEV